LKNNKIKATLMEITTLEIVDIVKETAYYSEPNDGKLVSVNLEKLCRELGEREDSVATKNNAPSPPRQVETLVILRPLILKYQRHKTDYDAIVGKIVSEGDGTQIYQALQKAEQELITKLIELVGAV
jgi:hypothetical protein